MIYKTKNAYAAPLVRVFACLPDALVCTSVTIEQEEQLPEWEDGGEL